MKKRKQKVKKGTKCDKRIHVGLIRFDTMLPVLEPATLSQTLNNGYKAEKNQLVKIDAKKQIFLAEVSYLQEYDTELSEKNQVTSFEHIYLILELEYELILIIVDLYQQFMYGEYLLFFSFCHCESICLIQEMNSLEKR